MLNCTSVFVTVLGVPAFHLLTGSDLRECKFQGRLFLHHSRLLSMQGVFVSVHVCVDIGLPKSESPPYSFGRVMSLEPGLHA